uniref:LIM domain-binding protein 2-like n=1 Tax=Sinocyclocheilus anshuiensis TaxID=1608454 RepID=A0A671MNH1_9TELE
MSNPPHDPFYSSPFGPFYRRHSPYMVQPEYRIYEMNKRLQSRTEESDSMWWDAFATEFFEEDATLTIAFCLEDGPKRYIVCHSGADARANVPTQDLQPQPERLSKDLSVPEVAKNGGPSSWTSTELQNGNFPLKSQKRAHSTDHDQEKKEEELFWSRCKS